MTKQDGIYRFLSVAYALLCVVLAGCLLISPDIIYWLFDLTSHPSADLLARRAGMMFIGLATFGFAGRNLVEREARQVILLGIGASMFGLFYVSVFEWARGGAGPGMWVAIIGELFFVVFAAWVWLVGRRWAFGVWVKK